ncbi:uncharacterized protein LOC144513273 [Sander vitreus]
MNMLLSLSLWLALMMSSCCVSSLQEEEPTMAETDLTGTPVPEYDYPTATAEYDYQTETPTPEYDYDYTFTFEVYYVNGTYEPSYAKNKASGIGRFGPVLLLGLAVHQIWN